VRLQPLIAGHATRTTEAGNKNVFREAGQPTELAEKMLNLMEQKLRARELSRYKKEPAGIDGAPGLERVEQPPGTGWGAGTGGSVSGAMPAPWLRKEALETNVEFPRIAGHAKSYLHVRPTV
jgi:hypothetical protein